MRNKGKEDVQGVEVGLTESVDWEKIWSRSPEGNVLPLALRELRRVRSFYSSHWAIALTSHRKEDVHTIITLTDNAPQGLNESLSSFPHATKVRPPLRVLYIPN
jgi:hypothetical protein